MTKLTFHLFRTHMQTHPPKNPSQGVRRLTIKDQAPDCEIFINRPCYDLKQLVAGKRLVDNGCGFGRFRPIVEAAGGTWVGVEPFEGGAHMVVGSAEDLPFEDETFDLAMTYANVEIVAYDIDPKARQACQNLAKINGVTSRLLIEEACTPEELIKWGRKGENLILCDCEGYEEDLFTPDTISALGHSTFIIETHDFLRRGVTTRLQKKLEATHHVTAIPSISDEKKVVSYNFRRMKGMGTLEKRYATAERRPETRYWLIAIPKAKA